MPLLPLIFTMVVAVMLSAAGWFLLFRTRSMLHLHRGVPERSGSLPKAAYAGLTAKPWFPLFLRFQGILCWLGALLLFALAASVLMFR